MELAIRGRPALAWTAAAAAATSLTGALTRGLATGVRNPVVVVAAPGRAPGMVAPPGRVNAGFVSSVAEVNALVTSLVVRTARTMPAATPPTTSSTTTSTITPTARPALAALPGSMVTVENVA